MDTTTCPDCGAPAEVTDRFVLESTDGPIEHVKLRCAGLHWFLLSTESLARHPRSVAVNELVNKAPPLDVPWPFRHVRETPTVGAMSQ